ncbi:MAG: TlpA disulfide reductase family protein [Planctomycetota bacterium]|nr:TlpA disulfide reductase family protein [Planctomycetota bacterium]
MISPPHRRPVPGIGSIQKILLLPLALTVGLIGYVVVAGSTGFCPTCASILSVFSGGMGGVSSEKVGFDKPAGTTGAFASLSFQDLQGESVSMERYLGKPVLVEVWATWCAPCRANRKILASAQDRLAEHAGLVSLSVDRGGARVVNQFLKNEHIEGSRWTELLATDPRFREVISSHDTRPTIPKLIYISPNGSVVDIEYGRVDPDWIVSRLKTFGTSGGVGG